MRQKSTAKGAGHMAKDLLVGSTGFVGGNLAAKHAFAAVCHSTDIAAQFGAKPDLCVYAGVPAAMFLANADPDADLAVRKLPFSKGFIVNAIIRAFHPYMG